MVQEKKNLHGKLLGIGWRSPHSSATTCFSASRLVMYRLEVASLPLSGAGPIRSPVSTNRARQDSTIDLVAGVSQGEQPGEVYFSEDRLVRTFLRKLVGWQVDGKWMVRWMGTWMGKWMESGWEVDNKWIESGRKVDGRWMVDPVRTGAGWIVFGAKVDRPGMCFPVCFPFADDPVRARGSSSAGSVFK